MTFQEVLYEHMESCKDPQSITKSQIRWEKKLKTQILKKKGNLCHGESERFWVGCAWFTGLRDQWMV